MRKFLLIFIITIFIWINIAIADFSSRTYQVDYWDWYSTNNNDNSTGCTTYQNINGSNLLMRVSSEINHDYLKYYFNDEFQWKISWRNMRDWTNQIWKHRICYVKDASRGSYSDMWWVYYTSDKVNCLTGGVVIKDYFSGSLSNWYNKSSFICITHNYIDSSYIDNWKEIDDWNIRKCPLDTMASWSIRNNLECKQWDDTDPSVWYKIDWNTTSNDTWSNSTETGSIVCTDTWLNGSWTLWSWCSNQQYYSTWSSLSNCDDETLNWITGTSKTKSTNWIVHICFKAKDKAWNWFVYTGAVILKVDKTEPTSTDVISTPSATGYFLANNSRSITIDVSSWWLSPITLIEAKFEKNTDNNSFISNTGSTWTLTWIFDMSSVDIDKNSNNYRDYTYQINKVCDEAWNCKNDIWKDFIYHVYAWNIDLTKSPITWTWKFYLWNSIADWSGQIITLNLKDIYWNSISPVFESGWLNQLRTVSLAINYDNSLYLNQFNNTWTWLLLSWFNTWPYWDSYIGNWHLKTTTISSTGSDSDDWVYKIWFKVFSPTINWNSFKINSITWSVSDITWNKTLLNNIDFKFKPIIELSNTWVIFSSWLVEWNTQTWKITIINNDSSLSITNTGIYLSMTWVTTNTWVVNHFTWTWNIDWWADKDIDKDHLINKFISVLSDWTDYLLKTLFTLTDWDWTVDEIADLRVREFIKYTIWGKTVTYLAWVINQVNNQDFEKLKIYWVTNVSNDKQKDLLNNQWEIDIHNIAWDINKAFLKRDIRKNAINTIKFVDTEKITLPVKNINNNSWDSSNWWKVLGSILYYEFTDWSNAVLWDGSELTITWKKTLIVRWWNLRITQNIINNSNSDILWIIVLKGDNWLWGKLYIDTDVDEIDAIIYTDKSIIWYNIDYDNGSTDDIIKHEVDWDINNEALDNQLYIYWSVFSENTLWASRLDPPVCPYWTTIQWISCDTIEAQKYDLNYLRTWLWDNPKFVPATWNNYPVVIKYNSAVQSTPPPLFGE